MWAKHVLQALPLFLFCVLLLVAQRWRYLFAYVSSVLCFSHYGEHPHWIVFVWFSYSFAFVDYEAEDHVILLTVTSIGQAFMLVFYDRLSEQRWNRMAIAFLLMIPFRCNNLHINPALGLARLVFYLFLYFIDGKRHWISRQYSLFATLEAIFFLFVWHIFIIYRSKEKDPVLPLTEKDRWKAKVRGTL